MDGWVGPLRKDGVNVPVSVKSCNGNLCTSFVGFNYDKAPRCGRGASRLDNRGCTARIWLLTYLPAPAAEPSRYACNFLPPGILENKIPSQ